MAETTGISWTDATWNPVVGCSIVSPACTHCYAMAMAARIERMAPAQGRQTHYAGTTRTVNGKPVWTGKLARAPDHVLTAPLRWRRPRRVFVNSMSDLFHEDMPIQWIDRVFSVMALAPQHSFQVLTKRPARMRDYLSQEPDNLRDRWYRSVPAGKWAVSVAEAYAAIHPHASDEARALHRRAAPIWPLTHIWLGVTAEDQRRADERIPDLLATPAAVRFVSAEPMLGRIDFTPWLDDLDWIIAGGESGPHARPMHPDWVRAIRDQCEAAGVSFHFKQWGAFEDCGPAWGVSSGSAADLDGCIFVSRDGTLHRAREDAPARAAAMRRVGKAHAGRELDGVIHDAFPARRVA